MPSLLEEKIKELIDELCYSDARVVRTDRKSVEFIMNEIVDFALAIVIPIDDKEAMVNIKNLKK